jgi:hypothetical protein
MIYLASPYSHADTEVREDRYRSVCRVAAKLMLEGTIVFSPIAHTHPIAKYGDLDALDADFYLKFDKEFIEHSEVVYILQLDGWKESYGVNWEINFAREKGIPVGYMNPETLEVTTEAA